MLLDFYQQMYFSFFCRVWGGAKNTTLERHETFIKKTGVSRVGDQKSTPQDAMELCSKIVKNVFGANVYMFLGWGTKKSTPQGAMRFSSKIVKKKVFSKFVQGGGPKLGFLRVPHDFAQKLGKSSFSATERQQLRNESLNSTTITY